MQEVMCAPDQLQDQLKSQGDEMEEINIACEGQPPKPLFISRNLSQEQKFSLVQLLKEYHDVFAWSYEEMPGLTKISLLMNFISLLEADLLNNKQECLDMR